MAQPRLGFIGVGKVGNTLARLLSTHGYAISGIASRTYAHADHLAKQLGASVFKQPSDVLAYADVVFLTVPDDAIASIADTWVNVDLAGKTVVHTSGTHSLDVLKRLAENGASIGTFHPAYPFATDTKSLNGVTFAVEGSDEITLHLLQVLALSLGGVSLFIPQGQKALYHAALCICSNYTVTLYGIAERLLISMGASKSQADRTLNPLLNATLANVLTVGVPNALTGPLIRNDVGTITAHLNALRDTDDRELYLQLAQATLPLLEQRGLPTNELITLFAKESAV